VLILGHNPGISNFANAIAASSPDHNRFCNFPTCPTWVAHFEFKEWKNVRTGIAASIDFEIPRELIEAVDNR
jgi:phosphohistidine phosphatase